jgi:Baseplate J-like protein
MTMFDPLATQGDDAEIENANQALAAAEGGYIAPSVETDQQAIAEQVFNAIVANQPGWQAHDGNLEVWMTEAWAEVAAEIRALAADVPAEIFQTYGSLVLGIPPFIATAAGGTATFTAQDSAGYTLDPGATFTLARSGNDLVAFQTTQQGIIAPGATTIDVPFVALETGAAANGLSGVGLMLDPIAWIEAVNVALTTSGGADAETAQAYLDRLTNLLRMVALRPILPQDFAILALQVPGVGRAVAMNLYDPATNTWTNERTITLVVTDDEGQPLPAALKQTVANDLESLREVNWVVNVIDPTYDTIAVTATVTAFAGQNTSTVQQACIDNLDAYLAPANFRLGVTSPAIAGGEVITPPTTGQPARRQVVRINDLIALLDNTLGVDFVGPVQINGAATDHTLTNPYTLPTPGTMTITVLGAQT